MSTTCSGGAGNASKTDLSPLSGRRIAILPDNDDPGRKHAEDLAQRLCGNAATVRIIELPRLPEGGDVSDWLTSLGECHDAAGVLTEMADKAPDWGPLARDTHAVEATLPTARPTCDDFGNAERLVRRHREDFKFCYSWGKWLHWDAGRWVVDDRGIVHSAAKQTIDAILDEVKATKDDGEAKGLLSWYTRSRTDARIRAMMFVAQSDTAFATRAADYDTDGWGLNCANGTINLQTGKLRPHRRSDLHTKRAPVNYDSDAKCALWERCLDTWMDHNVELIRFLQQLAGLWLTADIREQILPIFWGSGANGKSCYIDAILGILGDYGAEAPPSLLLIRGMQEHPTEIADLCGRRLVVISETEEGGRLRMERVKRLTGDSRLKGRQMRQDYFAFDRTHKTLLITNSASAAG